MEHTAVIKQSIIERLRARRKNRLAQPELVKADWLHKETIRSKLDGYFETNQFLNFARCGEEKIFRKCACCGEEVEFWYRCNLKWCPLCSWRLVKKRQQLLRIWASKVKRPKHLVLTQKNFPVLTRRKLKEHTQSLAKFRRSKAFEGCRGGSVSVEITNEGNGWHLHSHWLLDVDWLDMAEVSKTWGKLVGQSFAVVKIKEVGETDYVREVTKYVTEGSELAKWQPNHILEFVTAIKGRRFFFTFGTLRGFSEQVKAELDFLKPDAQPCDCGASDFRYRSEAETVFDEARKLDEDMRRQVAWKQKQPLQSAGDNSGRPTQFGWRWPAERTNVGGRGGTKRGVRLHRQQVNETPSPLPTGNGNNTRQESQSLALVKPELAPGGVVHV
jgi:Replication protein